MRPSVRTTFHARVCFGRRAISAIAQAILIPLLWSLLGIDALAQMTQARRDPASMIDRLIADPRVHLSRADVATLQTAAAQARQAVPRSATSTHHPTHS